MQLKIRMISTKQIQMNELKKIYLKKKNHWLLVGIFQKKIHL